MITPFTKKKVYIVHKKSLILAGLLLLHIFTTFVHSMNCSEYKRHFSEKKSEENTWRH